MTEARQPADMTANLTYSIEDVSIMGKISFNLYFQVEFVKIALKLYFLNYFFLFFIFFSSFCQTNMKIT